MTGVVRGDGMKYALAYNKFHALESIGIDGKSEKLIRYAYKNGNGRLKQMTYANGHTMKAVYNSIGQMVAEKWFETEAQASSSSATPIAHYKYVYDGGGNIVRSIDILCKKEYNYEYEEGRIIRATEADIELSGEIVSAKAVVNTVKYYYDTEGKMTRKVITPANGSAQTIYYETKNDNTVVKFSAGGRTVTSHARTDSFGRKVFDELQLGTDFVSRQFVYHAGQVTTEHKSNAKVKSSATTQLVSQIILSNGTTLSYGYDAEERITSVVETYTVNETPVTNTTLYTYDALGQLLTETVNGEVVNAMEYDNYGNITKKNGKAYTYGNAVWKDLLTSYNGQSITYDAQGNPTSYLGHTLTWEKGRQLKKFDNIEYTYNANGIRTSKKVNGILHTYTLDGTKILRETWGGNTLIPLYDNEDSVCGILYNDIPYYFQKNLQGDVIAIVDKDAQTIARYSYDAWGVPTIKEDTSGCNISTVNPFRYRGYYYDEEIGLYYLQSRYYDAQTGRFIISDKIFDSQILLLGNIHFYCNNNPINSIDSNGCFALAATAGGLFAVGATNSWNPAGWVLLAVAATVVVVGVCAVAIEASNSKSVEKAKKKANKKTLKDLKVKKQYGKMYQLAYISTYGSLIRVGKKLSFTEALACLGISGATNSISQRFTYNKGKSSDAQRQLEHLGKGEWGIYSHSQYAAKALATVLGCTEPPEIHGAGMYGHYHDSTHTFHIWYGGMINRY